jgi:hypothetical protein
MPHNVRTRYLPHGVTIEHPTIVTSAELAKILTAFGQQLLSAPQLQSAPLATPPKTEPDNSKPPPKRR